MLHSDWLLNMLDKSGRTPRERILGLFDILQDWTNAPGLQSTDCALAGTEDPLIEYLARQAAAQQLPEPDILATQIYFIALGALQTAKAETPGDAFLQGKQAAAVLLDAYRPALPLKSGAVAAAASVFVIGIALFLAEGNEPINTSDNVALLPSAVSIPALQSIEVSSSNSPDQVASLHDSLERIRRGVCQYPQALMLAPEARAVFLENVVHGSVPVDANQMREARQLMQKVECYYPPVAMTAL
jgi:hypothetical protein